MPPAGLYFLNSAQRKDDAESAQHSSCKKSDNNKQRHGNLSKPLQTRISVETRKPGAVKTILTHK